MARNAATFCLAGVSLPIIFKVLTELMVGQQNYVTVDDVDIDDANEDIAWERMLAICYWIFSLPSNT